MNKIALISGICALSISYSSAIGLSIENYKKLESFKLSKDKAFMSNLTATISQIPEDYSIGDFDKIAKSKNLLAIMYHKKMPNKKIPVLITSDGSAIMSITPFFISNKKTNEDLATKLNKILPPKVGYDNMDGNENNNVANEKALQALKEVPNDYMLEFKNSKTKKYAIVISDPECPYCRAHLKDKLPSLIKEMNVKIYFAPVHPKTASLKSQAILDAAKKIKGNDEKLALLNKYYADNYKLSETEEKLDINDFEKYKKHILRNSGIRGVPAEFVFDK